MKIYAIGDLHMDSSGEKPMDVFGEKWANHEARIIENWKEKVKEGDLVLLPGDTSWAMKITEVYEDLKKIDELPGFKVISKGNHDYWWETKSKLSKLDLNTIHFLHNDGYMFNEVGICGARGWISKDSDSFSEHDEKVYNRELGRLELSIKSIEKKAKKKVVMLHYPPFNYSGEPNEFVELMSKYDVDICVYGHLHSEGHKFAKEGNYLGVEFYCVSSDYIDFDLKTIMKLGDD